MPDSNQRSLTGHKSGYRRLPTKRILWVLGTVNISCSSTIATMSGLRSASTMFSGLRAGARSTVPRTRFASTSTASPTLRRRQLVTIATLAVGFLVWRYRVMADEIRRRASLCTPSSDRQSCSMSSSRNQNQKQNKGRVSRNPADRSSSPSMK